MRGNLSRVKLTSVKLQLSSVRLSLVQFGRVWFSLVVFGHVRDRASCSSLGTEGPTNKPTNKQTNKQMSRCGFATTQLAYDKAAQDVRDGLARLEATLASSPGGFVLGDKGCSY